MREEKLITISDREYDSIVPCDLANSPTAISFGFGWNGGIPHRHWARDGVHALASIERGEAWSQHGWNQKCARCFSALKGGYERTRTCLGL